MKTHSIFPVACEFFIFIQQKTLTSIGDEMDVVLFPVQWVNKRSLNKDKASGGCLRFWEELIVQAQFKIWTQLRRGVIDCEFHFPLNFSFYIIVKFITYYSCDKIHMWIYV